MLHIMPACVLTEHANIYNDPVATSAIVHTPALLCALAGASAALIVYDISSPASLEQVSMWRNELLERLDEATRAQFPIVVLANKVSHSPYLCIHWQASDVTAVRCLIVKT
jgi:Ras family